jgi:hypothetical protein
MWFQRKKLSENVAHYDVEILQLKLRLDSLEHGFKTLRGFVYRKVGIKDDLSVEETVENKEEEPKSISTNEFVPIG